MAVRASDRVTLAVLATPSYMRQYYLLQSSTLNPPAAPTANPPTAPWSTTEPTYTAGSTNTLYTVMLTAWGDTTFEYGPVQKSSAYEAAKQAYNLATQARNTADGKNKIFPSITAPTATAAGDQWWELDPSGASIIGVRMWNGTAWVPYQLVADEIIAAESVTAALIKAGSIQTSHVTASFGADLQLGSNSSVTTIINSLSETKDDVANVAQAADDAAQAAAGAQAGVDDVQGQMETLAGQQSTTAGQVAAISTWFRVDAEGAHVGRSDSAFQSHVKPGRYEITENGVVTSYWEGGRLVVPSLETQEVVLVKHKFEPYGDGTVVRAIGESV